MSTLRLSLQVPSPKVYSYAAASEGEVGMNSQSGQ